MMGWLWARHSGPAEAALTLLLLLPAAWDESPGASESPAGPSHLGSRARQQHPPLFLNHLSAQCWGCHCSAFCKGRAVWGTSKGLGRDRQHQGLSRIPKSDSSAPRVPSQARCWLTPVQAPNAPGRLGPWACGKEPAAGVWLG